MSLFKKMLRDIKINKTQFIAIFLMAFIGIFAYTGIYSEYYGLVQTSDGFYTDTNMADAWVYNTDFDDASDTTEGEDFNPDDTSGVWLDARFADARNLKVGDKISFEFDNQTVKKEIKGLGYSPEYVYEVSPNSLTPDFKEMGFAYLSAKSYPHDLKYNTLLVKYDSSYDDFMDKISSIDYLSVTKKEDHLSVSKFSDEMAQHKMIGNVFPIVFILVTFLTLLTTMSRIVTHQRAQIGILKAVGFKDKVIIMHYLAYAFFPVLAGSIIGLITGPMIIPQMFYPSMMRSYSMPSWHPGFDMSFIYIAVLMVAKILQIRYGQKRPIPLQKPISKNQGSGTG